MTDADIRQGCEIARRHGVATACVKPYSIPLAKEILAGSTVGICPVIGFPHGNSATEIKVKEAEAAARAGGSEIDMVINVGKALGGDWSYVSAEIKAVNDAGTNFPGLAEADHGETDGGELAEGGEGFDACAQVLNFRH